MEKKNSQIENKLDRFFALLVENKTQRNFEKVYLLTSAPLFGVVVKIVHNEEAAQECLQEAFIKIWNKVETYDPEKGKPITWLAAIARNQAIDCIRKKKLLVEDGFEIDSLSSDQAQEDETIEHSEEVLKLEECISQLQQNSRDAVFMAYYNEMTYENISKAVGFPVNTVKTWVRRSKDFLNRCMRGLH